MRQCIKFYIFCFLSLIVISSCTDEWFTQDDNVIREGIPVTVSFDLGVSSSKIISRAAETAETERTVNSVYVFAFNADGSLDNKQLFTPRSSTENCIENIEFSMHSGSDKRIYAIANPTSGSGTLSANYLATEIDTEEQLLVCTSSLLIPTNIERSYFLMSGKMEPSIGGGVINVSENGVIQGADVCSHGNPVIELERVDARITFKIYSNPSNQNYENFVFIPDRYWVENIPQHTYVFPHSNDYAANSSEEGYASMSDERYDVQRNVEGHATDAKGEYYYFEFYLAENRLTPKQNIANGDAAEEEAESLYALREKREKTTGVFDPNKPGKEEENGDFKYANANSTYVVFHGTLSYYDTAERRYVYADAEYTVHLGNTGDFDDCNNLDYVNNYRTERNTHYTYTVEIAGVGKMQVEVDEDREQRPGVEGDVIFSGDAVEGMDAHYGRTRFTLNKQDILDGLSWAVRTPLQSGMKAFDTKRFVEINANVSTNRRDYADEEWESLQTNLNLNDYKWVQFVINREAGYGDDDFAKYPGYQCYAGSASNDAYQPAPPFGGEGADPLWAEYPASGNVVLYDVNQLLNHLYVEAKKTEPTSTLFDNDGNVTITAFVDEYVYVYDPREVYYRSPLTVQTTDQDVNLQLWKDVVNRDNRMLYLCTTGAIYSPDGETSLSENVFTITQKPVYTFFSENDPDISEAWGTESINETGPISPVPPNGESYANHYPNENANGLPNTRNILYDSNNQFRNLNWDDLMYLDDNRENPNDEGKLQLRENCNNIWYACIARNRDLNGNNIVDEDEVRWYLASIDQLTDLWIGQWSLNESAWLYNGTGRERSHVASSTYYVGGNTDTGTPSDPFVIWGEEGASRGAMTASDDYNGRGTNHNNTVDADLYGNRSRYHYRCVRNLGISLEEKEPEVDPYVDVSTDGHSYTNNDGETYQEIILSLEGMESNSIRTAIVQNAELPNHTERDYTNRPYRKFAVIKNRDFWLNWRDGRNQWTFGSWHAYNNGQNVCPEGYRMPNQRELMLMYINIPNNLESGMIWFDPDNSYNDPNEDLDGFNFGGRDMDKYTNRYYVCSTSYEYNANYADDRPGFMYDVWAGLLFLETNSNHTRGLVRCLRDVPE